MLTGRRQKNSSNCLGNIKYDMSMIIQGVLKSGPMFEVSYIRYDEGYRNGMA
jgi:hypothetical protein